MPVLTRSAKRRAQAAAKKLRVCKYTPVNSIVDVPVLPGTYVVDIDGTVVRHTKDKKRVNPVTTLHHPNIPTWWDSLMTVADRIIFLTARDPDDPSWGLDFTTKQLARFNLHHHELHFAADKGSWIRDRAFPEGSAVFFIDDCPEQVHSVINSNPAVTAYRIAPPLVFRHKRSYL